MNKAPVGSMFFPAWTGLDLCIIGGGSSLSGFDFARIRGQATLGINEAYLLGAQACPSVIFGDWEWWEVHKFRLADYARVGGSVYCISPILYHLNAPWLKTFRRIDSGLGENGTLAWNHSTGAAAVNLGISQEAKRIFLLGFDMKANVIGQTHWHGGRKTPTSEDSFIRHRAGFVELQAALKKRKEAPPIYNVSPESKLKGFPLIAFQEMERMIHGDHKDHAAPDLPVVAKKRRN